MRNFEAWNNDVTDVIHSSFAKIGFLASNYNLKFMESEDDIILAYDA